MNAPALTGRLGIVAMTLLLSVGGVAASGCVATGSCTATHSATVKGTMLDNGYTAAEPRNRAIWLSDGPNARCTGLTVRNLRSWSSDFWMRCYYNGFVDAHTSNWCTSDANGQAPNWVHLNLDGSYTWTILAGKYTHGGSYTVKTTVFAQSNETGPHLDCSFYGQLPPNSHLDCNVQDIQ